MNLSLHHIGILVKDVSQSMQGYVSMGYALASDIIHDPIQTAIAQFLRLPGDSVFLELIAPNGPDSKLSNALKKQPGFHHVCYSTPGIEGACAALASEGWFLITPPVAAVAFPGRRIAWLRGADRLLVELVEAGPPGSL